MDDANDPIRLNYATPPPPADEPAGALAPVLRVFIAILGWTMVVAVGLLVIGAGIALLIWLVSFLLPKQPTH